MAWVRIDDQFAHHPKVIGAGPLGVALHVAGLCYCAQYLTDGFIPELAVGLLLDFGCIEFLDEDVDGYRVAARLVDWGIWKKVEGGYQIHDYLEYQPSKASVLQSREVTRLRVQKHRNGAGNADVTSMKQTRNTAPVPDPIPIPEPMSSTAKAAEDKEAAAAFKTFENCIGSLSAYLARKLEEDVTEFGSACVIHCLEEAAANGARNLKYAEAVMRRHQTEGCYSQPIANSAAPAELSFFENRYAKAKGATA